MDKIYKTINIDNSRSHRNGLLPFVHYKNHVITNVSDINGNYGHYVCDFGIFFEDEDGKIKEKNRLKYLDVIRWYHLVDESLKKSIYVKKSIVTDSKITKINCNDDESVRIETSTETVAKFYEDFADKENRERLNYKALDASFFIKDGISYIFEYPNEYLLIKDIDNENLTDSEIKLKEKVEEHLKILYDNNKYFVLLVNYDAIVYYNKIWKEWWENNFVGDWENIVFSGYESYGGDFKFCYDVEKYILGKIDTASIDFENIEDEIIPPYIYYTQVYDKNKVFLNYFFKNNQPLWQNQKESKDNESGLIFKYVEPLFEIPTMINSEYDYETLYDVYEYNMVKNEKEGAVKPFIPNDISGITYIEEGFNNKTLKNEYFNKYFFNDGIEYVESSSTYVIKEDAISANGLTKQWIDLSNNPIKCESYLTSLQHPSAIMVSDDIFGVYEVFNSKNEEGQLFKCVYHSGITETPLIVVESSGVTEKYDSVYVDVFDTVTIPEEGPKPKSVNTFIVGVKRIDENTNYVSGITYTEDYYEGDEDANGENKIIKTTYCLSAITSGYYGWWECEAYSSSTIVCGDDEIIKPNDDRKYRNVTILSCVDNIVKTPNPGDAYYFLCRYKNGNYNPSAITENGTIYSLDVPYKENEILNRVKFDDGTEIYDVILSKEEIITKDEEENIISSELKIVYAKGVTSGSTEESGIKYQEIFNYTKNKKAIVPIDGVYMAELYYNEIDLVSPEVTVFSDEYKLYRQTRQSEIIGMEVGTQWTEENAVDAFLITKDGSEGLSEEPKYDISLTYNRGNAAAWESHFKLSECNTMEDLKNYGNNYFNI
jgi:hypothetical protein